MRFLQILGSALLLLVAILVGRAFMLTSPPASPMPTVEIPLDRDFVDRFFTHVVNPEYVRGSRRTIRVVAREDDVESGDIVIALDDDAGRTLGLRFALRRGAPSVRRVGFVLSLLCRAHCRDFRSFAIKAR